MTAAQLCYWLMGWWALGGATTLTPQQVACIRAHIALVFEYYKSKGEPPSEPGLNFCYYAETMLGSGRIDSALLRKLLNNTFNQEINPLSSGAAVSFCYWLQGWWELGGATKLTQQQVDIVRGRLASVFQYHKQAGDVPNEPGLNFCYYTETMLGSGRVDYELLRKLLNNTFKHDVDPMYGDAASQSVLNAIHNSVPPVQHGGLDSAWDAPPKPPKPTNPHSFTNIWGVPLSSDEEPPIQRC